MSRILATVTCCFAAICGAPAEEFDPVRIDRFEHEIRQWCPDGENVDIVDQLYFFAWCDDGWPADLFTIYLRNDTLSDFHGSIALEYYDEEGYRVDGDTLSSVINSHDDPRFMSGFPWEWVEVVVPARERNIIQIMTITDEETGETADEYMARKGYASWGLRLRSDEL